MALASTTVFEVRTTGSSSQGGGFDVGSINFATDLVATSANTASPVVTTSSYSFVATDIGAWIFIKSGTNWVPGFYRIVSVAGSAATLDAAIGHVPLYGGTTALSTVAGCATVSSPTAGTFGVDYSQMDVAPFSYTDMVIGVTTTNFTSVTFPPRINLIGNIINITDGTGFIIQRVQVKSVVTSVATCDKSLGTTGSTGGNGKLGGALSSIDDAALIHVTSAAIAVKAGTGYTTMAGIALNTGAQPTDAIPYSRLFGYTNYRGDGGRATINSPSAGWAINISGSGWRLENLNIDCLGTGPRGIVMGISGWLYNVKIANFTTEGLYFNNYNNTAQYCEFTGAVSGANRAILVASGPANIVDCNIHDNGCTGIQVSTTVVERCLITNNAGHGIHIPSFQVSILNNIIHGNSGNGINGGYMYTADQLVVRNNMITGNGGYGLNANSLPGFAAFAFIDGNAYWNNTSGSKNNANDPGTTNPVHGVAQYINTSDVFLTADPYIAKASNDFRLNNNVGGGALCQGFGVPASWPGNSLSIAAPDFGAVQGASVATTVIGGSGPTYFSY